MQQPLLTTLATKARIPAALGTAAAPVTVLPDGPILVAADIYRASAVAIAIMGIMLARLVTIDQENKRLRRKQTMRETLPLTGIAVLIVAPFIWHYDISVPVASLTGLGVGYAVLLVLRVLGNGAVAAAKAMANAAVESLSGGRDALAEQQRPVEPYMTDLIDQIDRDEAAKKQ